MILTEMQYASLVISLSTLGQTDLAGNDREGLRTLEYLLEQAHANVRRALGEDHHTYAELVAMHAGKHEG